MKLIIKTAKEYPHYNTKVEQFENEEEAYTRFEEVGKILNKAQNEGKLQDYEIALA